MMFFFKKPKLYIDTFISEKFQSSYELAPIDYAHKFYPDWWKNLPKEEIENFVLMKKKVNAKYCASIIDTYKKGIIMPMWCDFAVKISSSGHFNATYANSECVLDSHSVEQRKGFRENLLQLKHVSPWFIKSEKDVFFIFNPAFMNLNRSDFEIIPGMVEYHQQNITNVNFFVEKKEQQISIPFGAPLVHIIPITERKIVLKNHLVSEEELYKIKNKTKISFAFDYLTRRKHAKENEAKCPFRFGSN